jgi:ABC-type Mn2+/Zn2+ transport system permease subunit
MPPADVFPPLLSALIMAGSMGVACAVLSVFVVARRWAFIGEGIAHAGFGGAGTAWVLSIAAPGLAFLRQDFYTYIIAVSFSLLVAVAVAALTRRDRVLPDTAIGILLVGSMAWGFLASNIYAYATSSFPPTLGQFVGFEVQKLRLLPASYAVVAAVVAGSVVAILALLGKEVLYYTFDADTAEVSGVKAGLIHYTLILLLAVTIVLAMRITGSLLVIGMLIIPGAIGLHIGKSLRGVFLIAVTTGLAGSLAGPVANYFFDYLPEGPIIVVALLAQFGLALGLKRFV